MPEPLSSAEIAALAYCYAGGMDGTRIAEAIPQASWDRLYEQGLLRLVRDFTGDGTSVLTAKGEEALVEAVAL